MFPAKIFVTVPAAAVVTSDLYLAKYRAIIPAKDRAIILVDDTGCAYVYSPLREVNYQLKQYQNYIWPQQANQPNNELATDAPTPTSAIDEALHDEHDEGWEPYLHTAEQFSHAVATVTQVAKVIEPYAGPVADVIIDLQIPIVSLAVKTGKAACIYLAPVADIFTECSEISHHAHEAGFIGHKHSNTNLHTNQFQHLINRSQACRNIVDDILDEIRRRGLNISSLRKDKFHELKKNLGAICVILNVSNDHTDPAYLDALLTQLDFSDRRLNKKLPFKASIDEYLHKVEARLILIAHEYELKIPAISVLKKAKVSYEDLKKLLQQSSSLNDLVSASISPTEPLEPSLPPVAKDAIEANSPLDGKIISIVGDGNCLFNAVIQGLRETPRFVNYYNDAISLRTFVADCISAASEDAKIGNSPASLKDDINASLKELKNARKQSIREGKPLPTGIQEDNLLETKEDYIRYIRTDRAWASTLETRFIAHYLNIHISTVDQTGIVRDIAYKHGADPMEYIFVLFNNNHYDAFVPLPKTASYTQIRNCSFFNKNSGNTASDGVLDETLGLL